MTEAQKEKLRFFGCTWDEGITVRQASDALADCAKQFPAAETAYQKSLPATETQKDKLRFFGCTWNGDITEGQANEALADCAKQFPNWAAAYNARPATEPLLAELRLLGQKPIPALTCGGAMLLIESLKARHARWPDQVSGPKPPAEVEPPMPVGCVETPLQYLERSGRTNDPAWLSWAWEATKRQNKGPRITAEMETIAALLAARRKQLHLAESQPAPGQQVEARIAAGQLSQQRTKAEEQQRKRIFDGSGRGAIKQPNKGSRIIAESAPVFTPPTPEQFAAIRSFGKEPPNGLTFEEAEIWIEQCEILFPTKRQAPQAGDATVDHNWRNAPATKEQKKNIAGLLAERCKQLHLAESQPAPGQQVEARIAAGQLSQQRTKAEEQQRKRILDGSGRGAIKQPNKGSRIIAESAPVFTPPTTEQFAAIRTFGKEPPNGLTFEEAKIWIEQCEIFYPAKPQEQSSHEVTIRAAGSSASPPATTAGQLGGKTLGFDWRNAPATEKQKEKLRLFGCAYEKDITVGIAKLLIDHHKSLKPQVTDEKLTPPIGQYPPESLKAPVFVPPSSEQLDALRSFGKQPPFGLTFAEAKVWIEECKQKLLQQRKEPQAKQWQLDYDEDYDEAHRQAAEIEQSGRWRPQRNESFRLPRKAAEIPKSQGVSPRENNEALSQEVTIQKALSPQNAHPTEFSIPPRPAQGIQAGPSAVRKPDSIQEAVKPQELEPQASTYGQGFCKCCGKSGVWLSSRPSGIGFRTYCVDCEAKVQTRVYDRLKGRWVERQSPAKITTPIERLTKSVAGWLKCNQTCLGGRWLPVGPLKYKLDSDVITIGLCRQLAEAIESKGHCVEPDARFGGGRYGRDQTLGLFKPFDGDSIQPSAAYLGAANLLRLCVLIATADGRIDVVELDVVRQAIESQIGLSQTEHKRLLILEQLLAQGLCSASKTVPNIAQSIPPDKRLVVGKLLVQVAAANDVVTEEELRALERIFEAFEIPPGTLEKLLTESCVWSPSDMVHSDVSVRDKWLWNDWRTSHPGVVIDESTLAAKRWNFNDWKALNERWKALHDRLHERHKQFVKTAPQKLVVQEAATGAEQATTVRRDRFFPGNDKTQELGEGPSSARTSKQSAACPLCGWTKCCCAIAGPTPTRGVPTPSTGRPANAAPDRAPAHQRNLGLPPTFQLDMERVDAITSETKEVVGILSVWWEDEPDVSITLPKAVVVPGTEIPAVPSDGKAAPQTTRFSGLDAAFHPVLERLLTRDSWARADFNALAREFHFMPLNIRDTINEWSDEALGDFVLTGEDPVVIRCELILKETS